MTREDLHALRRPLLALAATVLIAAAALYAAHTHTRRTDIALRQEQARTREAQLRLRQAAAERDLIVRYVEGYRRLEQKGIVGPARRIDWATVLRAANEASGLFGIAYQIGAEQPYAQAQTLGTPQLVVRESVMRLTAGLLHEGDLLALLASLKAQDVGLFVPQSCRVKRIPGRSGLRDEPQLDAECMISWLALEPRRSAVGP